MSVQLESVSYDMNFATLRCVSHFTRDDHDGNYVREFAACVAQGSPRTRPPQHDFLVVSCMILTPFLPKSLNRGLLNPPSKKLVENESMR